MPFKNLPKTLLPETLEFIVPQGTYAVVLRDGANGSIYPPGRHRLALIEQRIEVRLARANLPAGGPDVDSILFETSYRYLDGELVEIIRHPFAGNSR